ncbi:MAG: hypothetical protein EOO14_00875 [Chitinophagaceae bacterium]|nr:MAG: hypothetical protein EOO14_00875 [Chitinophagaceae bacterium]
MKQALDGTFDYKYVLDFDEAWKNIRQKKEWQHIISRHSFADHQDVGEQITRNPFDYIDPY